jgi:hypothetical protein
MSDNHHDREAGPLRSVDLLERIAELLDVPKAALMEGAAIECEIHTTTEMLRIWSLLNHPADRQRVLEFTRALADAQH